ncbi:uncharacterized protein [Phyllobates terribilis]|uniref:uncharacterized protein isoform X2 n=1 Tax=Phyllobates terribilis TaxID=111132 RepID=UPI003CCB2BDB
MDMCLDCGETSRGGHIFHQPYCCDTYIVTLPFPENANQERIDNLISEKIVQPLEEERIKCYYGSRELISGHNFMEAITKPLPVVPTIIMPVYKDRSFRQICKHLLIPNYLSKMVFLHFDSSCLFLPGGRINYTCLNFYDEYTLPKLIRIIREKANQVPVHKRKMCFELGSDIDSATSTSTPSEINAPLRRLDPFRRYHKCLESRMSPVLEEGNCFSSLEPVAEGNRLSLRTVEETTSPKILLNQCCDLNENISCYAAKKLTKIHLESFIQLSRTTNLDRFEGVIRNQLETRNASNCEMGFYVKKLYFRISAAIFILIYKYNKLNLKTYMKTVSLKKWKTNGHSTFQHCEDIYHELVDSLHANIKTWPNQLQSNRLHVKKMEKCLLLVGNKSFMNKEDATTDMKKYLTNLPSDVRHICMLALTEKIFETKCMESVLFLFSEIYSSIVKKNKAVFLHMVEEAVEFVQENVTQGTLETSLRLLEIISSLPKTDKEKDGKHIIILKHFLKKLVYHPLKKIRHFVIPLVFSEGLNEFSISELGSSFIKVDENLVEECIREHISHKYPEIIVHERLKVNSSHSYIFKVETPEVNALLYVLKQTTVNDILQTNLTDENYKNFQEIKSAVKICQNHENIVTLRKISTDDVLPFYVIDHEKSLLQFLHERENQLTWSQMLQILTDITKAVQQCHEKHVLIRDITPHSFSVFDNQNGFFTVQMANFNYAKSNLQEELIDVSYQYVQDGHTLLYQGSSTEPVAAFFSDPDTLQDKIFSIYTDKWMLTATLCSVLQYGKLPFPELDHFTVSQFVNEITGGHDTTFPSLLFPELGQTLQINFDRDPSKRLTTERLLEELDECSKNLGDRDNEIFTMRSSDFYLNPDNIERGYVDTDGEFVQIQSEELYPTVYSDSHTKNGFKMIEKVSKRMNLFTRKKLQRLNLKNLLAINEIICDSYTTTLIYSFSEGHLISLDEIEECKDMVEILSYIVQIATALKELHSQNVIHCDLRVKHIYVETVTDTVMVGHFGNAVRLENNQPFIIKMMPLESTKWSAPEVKINGKYSKASDIFSLGAVSWELLSNQEVIKKTGLPLALFEDCSDLFIKESCDEIISTDPLLEPNFSRIMHLLQTCWMPNPAKRPTLESIIEELECIKDNFEIFRIICNGTVNDNSSSHHESEVIYDEVPNDEESGYEDLYEQIIEDEHEYSVL